MTLDTTASTIEALSSEKTIGSSDDKQSKEWKVRCSVHGIGGLSLVPLKSYTPAASVRSRKRPTCHATNNGNDDERKTTQIRREDTKESKIDSRLWRPSVLKATHDCWWDEFIELPIRWRDLPRDAYLHFEVLGLADNVVRRSKKKMVRILVSSFRRVDWIVSQTLSCMFLTRCFKRPCLALAATES